MSFTPREDRPQLSAVFYIVPILETLVLIPLVAALDYTFTRNVASAVPIVFVTWAAWKIDIAVPFADYYMCICAHATMILAWIDLVMLQDLCLEARNYYQAQGLEQGKVDFWQRATYIARKLLRDYGYGHPSASTSATKSNTVSKTDRIGFVMVQAVQACWYFSLAVALKDYAASSPFGRYEDSDKPLVEFEELSIRNQLLSCWLFLFLLWANLSSIISVLFSVLVAAGFWRPDECTPFFGNFRLAYSLRNAWGKVWHQMYRRIATFTGNYLATNILGFDSRSRGAAISRLFLGFFFTGLTHVIAAVYTVGHTMGEWHFFLLQPIAMLLEDRVIAFCRKRNICQKPYWKLLGYLWVFCWFSFTMRLYYGPQVKQGLWTVARFRSPWAAEIPYY